MDVDDFLARPLVARVAVNGPSGPTVRPVWFLFEDGVLWWLTGSYSRMGEWLEADSRVAVVIDECNLETGEVKAVTLTGQAEVHPLDPELAARKLTKYLGPRRDRWPDRFRDPLSDPSTKLVSLKPVRPPRLRDLSFPPVRTPPV